MKVSYPKLHSFKLKNAPNVVPFTGVTRLEIDPNTVLIGALNAKLEQVLVLGKIGEGEYYFASSNNLYGTDLWLIEQFKKFVV